MNALRSVFAIAFLSLLTFNSFSQDEKWAHVVKVDATAQVVFASISSTGAGGPWSSPTTWAGGVVPGPSDNVTIIGGSSVLLDMDVTVASITVGDGSPGPSILSFDPSGDRVFTVIGDLTLTNNLSVVTSPASGVLTGSTLTIGGNVINNGTIDLSTNNNLTGAGLIFKGAANNTFSGTGSTDIRAITIDKGTAVANTMELTSSNFTVQGSLVDTAASGYLTLLNGTFKLSGTFTGNHRTFPTATYSVPATAGFWLNNPNYTVTAQNGDAIFSGQLQISDGVYNVGTTATNILGVASTGLSTGGMIIVNNGTVNVSGAMRRTDYTNVSYRQTGGTVTTCMAGNFAPCFDLSSQGSGGKLVIQTPATVPNDANPDFAGGMMWNTFLTFGNANTPGTGTFTVSTAGLFGFTEFSLAIDTTTGPHTVRVSRGINAVNLNDMNIGSGGTLDLLDNDRVYIVGDSYINNGIFKTSPTVDFRIISSITGNPVGDAEFSGSGTFFGPVGQLALFRRNMILGPGMNIRTRFIHASEGTIVNANRLTLGLNDNIASTLSLNTGGSLDSAPAFDLGTGGQKVTYTGIEVSRSTGVEINPTRELVGLSVTNSTGGSVLNVTGGDLTINGPIVYDNVIDMGGNKLRHLSGTISQCGWRVYVRSGSVVRRFSAANENYTFPVGNHNYCVATRVTASSLPSGPADVAVTGQIGALSGLNPSKSVPFNWQIQQTGAMTSKLDLIYANVTSSGNESSYRAYKSTGGGPPQVMIMGSSVSTSTDIVTVPVSTDLTAGWGIGERPTPVYVNISGTVLGSNGAGIRNAIVRLEGGELQSPRFVYTGSLGTFSFTGIQTPELEYTITVSAKRYRFAVPSQTITPTGNITDLNFTANPQWEGKTGIR